MSDTIKPKKKEHYIAGTLLIVAMLALIAFSPNKPAPLGIASIAPNPSDSVIQAQSVVPIPSSSSGGASGGGGNSVITPRIEAKSSGIIGQINRGQFEDVATQIRFDTEQIQGFVKSSDLIYSNSTWSGNWVLNVPTPKAQDFTFHLRQLIDSHGRVLSIQQKTQDVTEQVKGNASAVPYSSLAVKLRETSTTISQSPMAQFFPAFQTISDIGSGTIYWTIIGLPTYGLILLLVMASRRIFIPILLKVMQVSKVESTEAKEQPQP